MTFFFFLIHRATGCRKPWCKNHGCGITGRCPSKIFLFSFIKHAVLNGQTAHTKGCLENRCETQKFLDTRSSISQSASTCLCSGAPRPVGDLAGAATFLSNRKYRYRPCTQPDVGNCWPCVGRRGCTTDLANAKRAIFIRCLLYHLPVRISTLNLHSQIKADIHNDRTIWCLFHCFTTQQVDYKKEYATKETRPPHIIREGRKEGVGSVPKY